MCFYKTVYGYPGIKIFTNFGYPVPEITEITENAQLFLVWQQMHYWSPFQKSFLFDSQCKTGPFAEHSPMLWGMTSVQHWQKINTGLMKMYKAEVTQVEIEHEVSAILVRNPSFHFHFCIFCIVCDIRFLFQPSICLYKKHQFF